MSRFEQLAKMSETLFNAEVEVTEARCDIRKKRVLDICANSSTKFSCTLDLDISFSSLKENGTAHNKAEVFLLPEELSIFTANLIEYPVPLPTDYRQRMVSNPQIICLYMESVEAPEHFMGRFARALNALEEVEEQITAAL